MDMKNIQPEPFCVCFFKAPVCMPPALHKSGHQIVLQYMKALYHSCQYEIKAKQTNLKLL